jgi:hypothetical protein
MSNVDVFEILVAAVCSANVAVFAITWVHELIEFIKKKRYERAETQEIIALLKEKNHQCSIEINALNARIAELTEELLKEKLLKGGNNGFGSSGR